MDTQFCKRNQCSDFQDVKTNACNLRIRTVNCNPSDPQNWFQYNAVAENPKVDPVMYNIYNGCWLCQYEPQQTENNILCQRQFFDKNIQTPYSSTIVQRVSTESNLQNIELRKQNPRSCVNK